MNNLQHQYAPSFNYEELQREFVEYFSKDVWITEHEKTKLFEKQLSSLLEVPYCFTTNNGTISLSLALLVMGVKAGDEVLVPNLTMIATINAVLLIGAVPVLVDVEKETLCMDMKKAEALISSKTKAILYVSFNGRFGNVKDILSFATSHSLMYIEDDAQAMGSCYSDGVRIGSRADIASFSFSSPKIITTGQGGCLGCCDSKIAEKIKKIKDFGRTQGGLDIHSTFGINSKFTDIQAVVGLSQLKNIEARIACKKVIFYAYHKRLKDIVEFIPTDLSHTVPWFVDIYVKKKNELQAFLRKENIPTRSMYPPINEQDFINHSGNFSVSKKYSSNGLWLPCSLGITIEEIELVCNTIKEFYK